MPEKLTPLEWAEGAILLLGVLLILGVVIELSRRRCWGAVVRLPAPPETTFEATDPFVGLMAFILLPGLFAALPGYLAELLGAAKNAVVDSQPASAPSEMLLDPAALAGQMAGTVLLAGLLLHLGRIRVRGGWRAWGWSGESIARKLGLALLLFIGCWPTCVGLLGGLRLVMRAILPSLPLPEHPMLAALSAEGNGLLVKGLVAFGAIVMSPLVEELFFRGVLQVAAARWLNSTWAGVLVAACGFGLMHWEVYDTVPVMVWFGIVLGYAYAKTGSLTLAVLIHVVFNAKNVLFALAGAEA